MRTDREALIAGIAADPHNDLRKLVFADWLEEHGEPDRAEFIRLAVGNKNAATRTKATEERAKTLFAKHWRKWFGPFFEALDPVRGDNAIELGPRQSFKFRSTYDWSSYLRSPIECDLGLLHGLALDLETLPDQCSLDLALRLEPIWWVSLRLGSKPLWTRLIGPSLDQISHLSFSGPTCVNRGVAPPDSSVIFNDQYLTGVRTCDFSATLPDGSTPVPLLETFAASLLARQIRSLMLSHVATDDLRHLCESRRVTLDRLHLFADKPRRVGEMLASARFATTLKELTVQLHGGHGLKHVSPMLLALCEGTRWNELTTLHIHTQGKCVGVTNAGLRALAKASFLPQLEVLSIPLDADPDPRLVAAVIERLDPARVRRLRFVQLGDVPAPMPEFFARKFGDRACEGVDKTFGTAYWQVVPPADS